MLSGVCSCPMPRRSRRARILLTVAAILLTWSAVVAITGGFRLELWGLRISSRNALRIFLIGAVPAVWAWRLAYVERLDAWLRAVASAGPPHRAGARVRRWRSACWPSGVRYGSHAVAASDQSGYVSESALWARGTPRIDVGFAANLPWPDAKDTLMPLGYRIGAGGAMVPTYAPGLPLLMALARVAGVCGPFLVMPVCGGDAGVLHLPAGAASVRHRHRTRRRRARGVQPGDASSCRCTPMADLPAAAFWIGALALAIRGTPTATVVAAIFTGVAIVIRPEPGAAGDVPLADDDRPLSVRCRGRAADGAVRGGKHLGAARWSRGSTTCCTDRR